MTRERDEARLRQFAEKAGGRVTPEGLMTTRYTFEDAMEIEVIEARLKRFDRYRGEMLNIIRDNSSVNMTAEACDRQAEAILKALTARGFLKFEGDVS